MIDDYYSKSEKKADGGLMDLGGKEMDLSGGSVNKGAKRSS